MEIRGGGLNLTGISRNLEFFTFTPGENDSTWDLSTLAHDESLELIIFFENVDQSDIEIIKLTKVYYFKHFILDGSCVVDRFSDFPLNSS